MAGGRAIAKKHDRGCGGEDRRTLFLTGAASLWSIDLPVAGLPY